MNRLTLLTTRECHLCGAAREALDRVAARTGEEWTEVDVADDAALARDYGDRLPVLLLDGKEHGYWDVDVPRLLRDLGSPAA
ncbi:glutaredoxin family protein [Glycomyces sp. NPDC047369]